MSTADGLCAIPFVIVLAMMNFVSIGSRNWEKEKAVPIIASSPAASIAKPTRKRGAESPPSAPLAKVIY